jgi:valyl-tRNA synthetase
MAYSTEIWEGWTIQDFIDELEVTFKYQTFHTFEELKNWCISEQPFYKKHIPEVYNHFIKKVNFKPIK